MSRAKPLLQLTTLVVLLTTLAIVGSAQQHSPCEAYGHAISIFVGKVTGIEPISLEVNQMGGGTYPTTLIRYSVEERFKGEASATEEAVGGLARQVNMKVGDKYLVYTFGPVRPYKPDKKVQLVQPVSDALVDLYFLRSFQEREPVASVSGKVLKYDFDVANWKLREVTPPDNVRIFLENSRGVRRETRTDYNDTFRFDEVVPGLYKVIIDTPAKLYTPVQEIPVDLIRTPCSHFDFRLQVDGRVSGKVVDAEGKPVPNVPVSLVPVELMPSDDTSDTTRELHDVGAASDDQGRFLIRGVPAGRYLLGVNLPNIESVFPRTFYPGTPNRAQAKVIELSEGGEKLNQDFQLPPRRLTRIIEGSAVLSNGNPAVCAMVGLVAARYATTGWPGEQIRVEKDGSFKLGAVDGYKYVVMALVPVNDEDGHVVGYVPASSGEVMASEKTEPVRLVMPPKANCDYFLTHPH